MLALGLVFTAIGLVGVILPVLPTTPFMLLALWAFSRSSRRFHVWLYTHHLFGPPLQTWHLYRVIPSKVKVFAISIMSVSWLWLAFGAGLGLVPLAGAGSVMAFGAGFILHCPSHPPPDGDAPGR
ncbi:MAG: YbaN family protein [Proteobacteria bacterium]|nr:YbaN family protein [Pseudomonadota bacterium]